MKNDYSKEVATALKNIVELMKIQTEYQVGFKVDLTQTKEVQSESAKKAKKRKK